MGLWSTPARGQGPSDRLRSCQHLQSLSGSTARPLSIDALRWAADYARLSGSPLLAVSAWHLPVAMVIAVPAPEGFDPMAEAQQTLDAILADELGTGPGLSRDDAGG